MARVEGETADRGADRAASANHGWDEAMARATSTAR